MKQEIKIGQEIANCENCSFSTFIKFGLTICDRCKKLLCVTCQEKGHYCPKCLRCNDGGCPACDTRSRGSKYHPEPY